jgi:hypothetical protein
MLSSPTLTVFQLYRGVPIQENNMQERIHTWIKKLKK